uniref:hypothetical protein Ycf80 n=1 Tax=Aphanocladia delicatula TaxID=3041656 RepID=UPI002551E05E|nr:hypothetical protein Ycf80 [Aphanocladia delicatula]WGH14110.1 hypothetical protein Ycf80 [Aphanocladia delicatula]
MILFNFILFYKLGQIHFKSDKFCQSQLKKENLNISNEYFNQNSKLNICSNILISNMDIHDTKRSYNQFTEEIEDKNLLSRNFWQKLINKYLQETIFISSANAVSSSYLVKLKASGLSIYTNNGYKNFLYKFSKDLLRGKVNVVSNNIDNEINFIPIQKDNIYLKYKWSKLCNFKNLSFSSFKQDLYSIFRNITTKSYNSSLPLFIVVNNNNEIVVSESTDQLSKNRITLNKLSYFIQSNKHNKSFYLGLLFVNPRDAIEYRDYIRASSYNSTLSNNINVVVASTQLYYNLMMLRNKNTEFRLIPDLTEVSNLIYKYKKYKNISFNMNQKYSNNSFQGQPIYTIKPIYVKKRFSNYVKKLEYLYPFKKDQTSLKQKVGFLNYSTLIGAWKQFKQENYDYDLPSKPDISVSNFEAYIQNPIYQKNYSDIIFLPSVHTYNFIQRYSQISLERTQGFKYWLFNKSISLKISVFKVFWSLTSRQPTNW